MTKKILFCVGIEEYLDWFIWHLLTIAQILFIPFYILWIQAREHMHVIVNILLSICLLQKVQKAQYWTHKSSFDIVSSENG